VLRPVLPIEHEAPSPPLRLGRERWIPETPEEVAEHDQAMKPAVAQRLNPDGSVKKHWEP